MNPARQRSEEFLRIADQFRLGALTTEASHPVTASLSETAQQDTAAALRLLFDVDQDVVRTFREFVQSGRAGSIKDAVLASLADGGRLFFTGCGSTGRLSIQLVSIWRDFWQQQRNRGVPKAEAWELRALSVMAGGDFALIKSVEGFEDFAAFGRKQIADLGVAAGDVVFAITEGGETSFVIGTAWQGVAVGAKVFFVYNNPDAILAEHVQRSREVLADPRIEKLNLTTGPMAISGSTRMQATSIQLCVLLTVLEMVLRDLTKPARPEMADSATVPGEFLKHLETMLGTLRSPAVLTALAALVEMEAGVYRAGRKNTYFAQRFALDVLTDTTERSPTYCTPSFRKHGDALAAESWSFLFLPEADTEQAWERVLKRPPCCVEWSDDELRALVAVEQLPRTQETLRRIRAEELLRFRIGLDGLPDRPAQPGDSSVAILSGRELELIELHGSVRAQLDARYAAGARVGLVVLGSESELARARELAAPSSAAETLDGPGARVTNAGGVPAPLAEPRQAAPIAVGSVASVGVFVPVPETGFLLDGVTRVGLKLLLNALSTATMVRLGRVMGNTMIWVVASNLKLMDRATRYIQRLAGLDYPTANLLLFEALEYVAPRMKADQAYPPVVGLAVLRARHGISHEEAEQRLAANG